MSASGGSPRSRREPTTILYWNTRRTISSAAWPMCEGASRSMTSFSRISSLESTAHKAASRSGSVGWAAAWENADGISPAAAKKFRIGVPADLAQPLVVCARSLLFRLVTGSLERNQSRTPGTCCPDGSAAQRSDQSRHARVHRVTLGQRQGVSPVDGASAGRCVAALAIAEVR